MSRFDHEIKIGTADAEGLKLIRDDEGKAMYRVYEETPNYRNPLLFTQSSWLGGHGQYNFEVPDMYFEGQSIDTTQDGRVFLGPLIYEVNEVNGAGSNLDSSPLGFCWFPATSEWLCYTTDKIYRYDVGSSGKWTAATQVDGGAGDVGGVTDLKVFGTTVFAACGSGTAYKYSTDGDDWTTSTLDDTGKYANLFFVAPNPESTAKVFWKFKNANELTYNDSGTNAGTPVQWTSPAYIGDISSNGSKIFMIGDNLMIGKTDNLYHYDANGGVHPLMDDRKINRSTNNFKYVTEWQKSILFSLSEGMGEITSYNAYDRMGPLYEIGNIGKIGTVVGVAGGGDYVYVAVDEGTNTIIYKGREVRKAGTLRWEWCPWVFLGENACASIAICQHDVDDKRLWFAYGDITGYVKIKDNPTATNSGAAFAPTGFLRTSYFDGSNRYWDKLWQSVVTETAGCSSGIKVTPKYRDDTDTDASDLTSEIITNGTVKTNLSSHINNKRIQFELHLANGGTSASTPEVSFFEARGVEKPETVRIHECVYELGDKPTARAETLRTFLRGGRTSTSLIKFADLRYGDRTSDTTYTWVVLQPGSPEEIEVTHEKGRQPELGLRCRFQEVSYTVS